MVIGLALLVVFVMMRRPSLLCWIAARLSGVTGEDRWVSGGRSWRRTIVRLAWKPLAFCVPRNIAVLEVVGGIVEKHLEQLRPRPIALLPTERARNSHADAGPDIASG
jgi:hypothetical protein